MTTSITIRDVNKQFGGTVAVDHAHLDIAAGELFFLLGPSGCGKSTLLRILAGFVTPDSGDIYFGPERINDVLPRLRGAAMVFQVYALWPHMTVADNVAYGLRVQGLSRKEIAQRVESILQLVRMDGLGKRRPAQLSGGQQQRVALARALVVEPRVLLLDEPLSNLDARLRDEMRHEIRRLHEQTHLTMVYVTHDQKEALTLADRVAVMDRGKIVQVGTAREVYERPVNRFVAQFLGDCNLIPGIVRQSSETGCVVQTAVGTLTGVPAQNRPAEGAAVICAIRPHALVLNPPDSIPNRITARVTNAVFLGHLVHLDAAAEHDTPLQVVSLPHDASRLGPGQPIMLGVPPEQVVLLEG
jgi:iron(III) transport system ATP-binding protein